VLILASVLLALLVAPLAGGGLRRLAELRWRAPWLVLGALLVQLVVLEVPGLPEPVAAGAHLATYAAAAAFVLLNRAVPGLLVLALGALSNGVTILLNGGTLPSTAAARALAGLDAVHGFTNSGILEHPVLPFLGDVFAVPSWFPLANVFSVGDVLVVAGAWWVVLATSRGTRGPYVPRHGRPLPSHP